MTERRIPTEPAWKEALREWHEARMRELMFIWIEPGRSARQVAPLEAASKCVDRIVRHRAKILVCGNGGSATQASHFAAELIVRYKRVRRAIPCISLAADQAVITACANDLGFELVFARQIEALGQPGDILIPISTSGKSLNILRAIAVAVEKGIAILEPARYGVFGGIDTASIQEYQMRALHMLADSIECANPWS